MLSDERSKINDLFEKEVKELSERFEKRKLPILEKRDKILAGTLTEFDDYCIEFDNTQTRLQTAVAGIVKTEEEKKDFGKLKDMFKPLTDWMKDTLTDFTEKGDMKDSGVKVDKVPFF